MSFYREELFVQFVCFVPCKLILLLIPFCSTLVLWSCIEVSCVLTVSLDYVERRNFVLWMLLCPSFGARILCLFFQTVVSVWAKEYLSLALLNASHAQGWLSSGYPWSFNFQEPSWINLRTVICNIDDNCNRWLLFVGFFCFTFFFSWRTGRSFRLFRVNNWIICGFFHLSFEMLAMRVIPVITLSIMTTISSFAAETRRKIFVSWWTSPCLPGALSFCGIVSLSWASWSSSFAFPFLCRFKLDRTFSTFRDRGFWCPRSTMFSFLFSSFPRVCCCSDSWTLFEKSTFSVVAARGCRWLLSSIFSSFSAPFSQQCLTDWLSSPSSWVYMFSFVAHTSSPRHAHPNHYQGLILFLPKHDSTCWGCRCTARR